MKCDACVKHVSDTLYGIGGISKVEGNLEDQLVLVEGTGKGDRGLGVRRPGTGRMTLDDLQTEGMNGMG